MVGAKVAREEYGCIFSRQEAYLVDKKPIVVVIDALCNRALCNRALV